MKIAICDHVYNARGVLVYYKEIRSWWTASYVKVGIAEVMLLLSVVENARWSCEVPTHDPTETHRRTLKIDYMHPWSPEASLAFARILAKDIPRVCVHHYDLEVNLGREFVDAMRSNECVVVVYVGTINERVECDALEYMLRTLGTARVHCTLTDDENSLHILAAIFVDSFGKDDARITEFIDEPGCVNADAFRAACASHTFART